MTFEEKIKALNPSQRHAVETIEGPVMVIAGPGTGKTEILIFRIGYILQNTDTPAGSILCLTYTDAAATEMRQRLIEYIGPDAYRIHVSTFHSFCNMVIQENPSVFLQVRELEPISEVDRFRLLQQLIDSFPPDHKLKKFKGQTYSDWKRLDELFTTMKKENWSPDYMQEQISEYIERQRQSEDFIYKRRSGENQKGDFKVKDFQTKVLDKMETLSAAVDEYITYNSMLAEQGKYDFDDMLLWVNRAFRDHVDLLNDYQERFLYFLVDEFQDTNGIQMDVLRQLIEHEWIDRPNVFVVGDDDQAIFRFQGANIENLTNFYKLYEPEVILLEENYRSAQRILDAARLVMNKVDNSLLKTLFNQVKKLKASGEFARESYCVSVQSLPTLSYENAHILHQLKIWHEAGGTDSSAVLYARHESGRELAQALRGAGIPFQTVRTSDALSNPLILHLLDIIQCIHQLSDGADNDDGLLFRILHLRYLEPRTMDLQRLILSYTSKPYSDPATLYMWMGNKEKLSGLSLSDPEWMLKTYNLIEESIIEYHSRTLLSFVEWIVHRFGIMNWILAQEEKLNHLYTIKAFYSFIEAQSAGKPSFRVPSLLEICDLMTTYNLVLPVHEISTSHKGIHLSTLHGAKGLQYENVIIKNLTENEWEKKRSPTQAFSYPDNLVRKDSLSLIIEAGTDVKDEDRRRLLYVGMTRAKKKLIMTYAKAKDDNKALIPSLYLPDLSNPDAEISRENIQADEAIMSAYLIALMSGEQKASLHKEDAIVMDRVRNLVLNATSLNEYIECPLGFYYKKILMVPATESAPLLFGTTLHHALQRFFRKRYVEKDMLAGKDYLLSVYEWELKRIRHRFTSRELENFMAYGKQVLDKYFDKNSSTWSDEIQYELEYKIKDVEVDGVPVKGFIDRIDKFNDTLVIYDYKSGKPDNISKKLKPPADSEPGGNYWRQMVFYDLLLRRDPKLKGSMTSGYIHALEPFKDGRLYEKLVPVTEEDRMFVTAQIKDVWQKIQQLEFENGCGECEWCRMHDLHPPMLAEDDYAEEEV
jgi:DNA helicase-2/ATP-dependent DNA helicase PcrA